MTNRFDLFRANLQIALKHPGGPQADRTMMTARLPRFLAVLVASTIVTAACGTAGSSDDTSGLTGPQSPNTGNATNELPDLTGETISVWTAQDHTAQEVAFEAFEQETGVKFDIQILSGGDGFESQVQTKWATGDRPDLLAYHAGPNHLIPLQGTTTLHDLSNEAFVDNLFPFIREGMSVDGKIYGAPLQYPSLFALWYNIPLFDRLHIDAPTNHSELLDACQIIQREEPDVTPLLTTGGDGWVPIMLPLMYWGDAVKDGFVDRVVSGEASLEDAPIVDGIAAFKELVDAGCFNDDIQTAVLQQKQGELFEGKYASIPLHAGIFPSVIEALGEEKVAGTIGQAPISLAGPTPSYFLGCCDTFYVPKTGNSVKEEASRAFIRWVTGDYYPTFIKQPPRMPVYEGVKPPGGVLQVDRDAAELLESGDAVLTLDSALPAGYGDFPTVLAEVIAGTQSPDEAAATLQREFERNARATGVAGY